MLCAKGKRKLHFVLYMSETQRFTSPGVLTEGCGPKERTKHHEVSVLWQSVRVDVLTSEGVSLSCAEWGTAGVTCGFIAHSLLQGTASSFFLLVEHSMERVSVKSQYLPFHHRSGRDTVNFSPLTLQQGDSHHSLLPECFSPPSDLSPAHLLACVPSVLR